MISFIETVYPTSLACILILFAGITQADSMTIDAAGMIRDMGLENELSHITPGNSSNAVVEHATITLSSSNIAVDVAFRFHVKQRACTSKPWPLKGKWCVDTYNFWTSVGARFTVGSGCIAQGMDVYKYNTSGVSLLDEALVGVLHEVYKNFESRIEGYAKRIVNEKIRGIDNPTIRMFCG